MTCLLSLYAGAKVSGKRLWGRVHPHLYGIRLVTLRVFTVSDRCRQPDLAIPAFAERILRASRFRCPTMDSRGASKRSVGDDMQGVCTAMDFACADWEVINLGNDRPGRPWPG